MPIKVFENFWASFNSESSNKSLLAGVESLQQIDDLFKFLEVVQDYEIPDEILFQKFFVEFRTLLPTMYDNSAVLFRLNGLSKDMVVSCLNDEKENLGDFYGKNNTLSLKIFLREFSYLSIGLFRHCL